MNARLPLLAAAALSFLSLAPARGETIVPSGTYSQNFDSIGTSTSLPSGWTANNSSSARSVTKALYESAGSATTQVGTGTGTSNGIWNYGDAGATSDRGVGFLASGNATKTGNLYLTLVAGGAIPDFTISYDMKCYRNNSTQFQFQMYYSTDGGDTWTSAGASFCTTYATGTGGVVNPAGVTSVSSQKLEVPVSSGGTIIFCWSYSVPSGSTTSNAQGLGVDNVVIVAGQNQSGLTVLPTPENLEYDNVSFTSFTLSWDSVEGATGYSVTLSPAEGNISTNGTTATVTGLAEGTTYTASVVAKGDGTTSDDSNAATKSVTTLIAPAVTAPVLTESNVSPSSFTVSWPAQNDATFSVRAWTLVPADVATEEFEDYAANGTVPEEWVFKNSHDPFNSSTYSQNPVDFKNTGDWIASPEFGGSISTVSFRVRSTAKFTGSFAVYGTTGSTNQEDWVLIQEWERDDSNISVSTETFSNLESSGFRRIVFKFMKSAGSGNIAMGSFSVTGTNVGKQPSYLAGYGPTATAAGATSVTISNPVKNEKNYVEVTATGLTGRTATSTLPVFVPGYPAVITVK